MNLLDQKLKDKLKLFDNIDKELESSSFKLNKSQNKLLNNSQSSSNIINAQFNQIYSNFLMGKKNNNNNLLLNITSNHTYKNSIDTKKTNLETSRTSKSISKNLSNSNSNLNIPNNSGNRLYNYGFYLKNKLEKRRRKEEEKIHSQMTPKLYYTKSNNIYNNNSNLLNNNNHSSDNLTKKKNHEKNIYNNQYTYRPKLNKNSLKIAQNLESSSERLIRKRKKNNNSISNKENKQYYNNIYFDSSHSRSRSNSTSPSSNNKNHLKRCNDLYNKGIEQILKREQIYQESKLKKEEEYKKYSFKPKLNNKSNVVELNYINNSFTKSKSKNNTKKNIEKKINDIYRKQYDWKRKLENKNMKKREDINKEEIKHCTFKPEISHLNIENDEKFILKNLQQMNDYVIKRRDIIQKQKEYEEYKNKRLGNNSQNFVIKTTIPKEFEFQTNNRSRSHSKERVNINNENKVLGNNNYGSNDNGYCFFNNNISGNNFDQKDFIDAINELHYRIDNLNI